MMKKILVIEDEIFTRNLLSTCLETEGFQTIKAETGLVGIHQAQQQVPDLIICDILMPELDGYGVLSALRRNAVTAAIPLIFLTAGLADYELPQSVETGLEAYLTKPTTADELLKQINLQLQKHPDTLRYPAGPLPSTQLALTPALISTPLVAKSIFPAVLPAAEHLNKVFEFIEANYHQPITLNDVAQAAGYSPAYLTNLVGCQTGRTVSQWIIERRMVQSRFLLQHSDWSIEHIAQTVGYTNIRHFFRQFRQCHGVTPQVWRIENRMPEYIAGEIV